ncbi:transglycosylase family protein [Streptomyces sp. NPDC012794]|uniref:transglycosylase family protein n=1 Tax=Streptomyces sp. NPDC012794 TaxID=3364850 RepID=UPI0036BA6EF9
MSRNARRPRLAVITATALAAIALSTVGAGSAQAASVATWDKVAQCESTGNWSINTGNGYYGGLQILKSTWDGFGGRAYAAYPHQATKQQQILIAEKILAGQGAGAWGGCGSAAGLAYDHADPYPGDTAAPAPVSKAGDVYHASRMTDGSWTSFQPLNGYGGAAFFNASQESIAATPDGSTQTLATGSDGNLYHTARYSNGTWTAWAPLPGYGGAAAFGAKDQAITGMGSGDAHVMAIGNDSKIYQNTRFKNGTWAGWTPVGAWQAKKIATAGLPDGSTQTLIVGNDGNLYHATRSVEGTWTGWNAVAGLGTAPTFQAGQIAIAGLPNGDTQLLATGNDGLVYHNVRLANGTWQGWSKVDGYGGAPSFAATSLAITGMPNGDTQMLAVGNDGKTYHAARYAAGNWQGWWATGMGAQKVAIAGLSDGSAQMLATRN